MNRKPTHYAYRVGQIVYIAKHHRGSEWTTLSILLGRSAEFDPNPTSYVAKARTRRAEKRRT